jgi:hypothetical protein
MGNDLIFKVKIMDDVAPGILLEDDSRSIAKGLTSKTDRVLSKTSQSHVAIVVATGDEL